MIRYAGGACAALVQAHTGGRVLLVALAPWGLWRGWVAARLVTAGAGGPGREEGGG